MENIIYFYANCGNLDSPPIGGGEIGNRRTLALFKKCGYKVKHIEKYHTIKRDIPGSVKNISLLFIVSVNLLKYFVILLFGRRQKSYVHISGFYGAMVYFENALVSIAKCLGYKVVYEMRGGGADHYYKTFGNKYCKAFDSIIQKAECIFSQGLENYPLIKSICPNKRIYYYANYVMNDFLPPVYPIKSADKINILYFGRISPNKNIDMIIDAVKIVNAKIPITKFTMVGDFRTKEFGEHLHKRIEVENLENMVYIKPACMHEELKEYLKDQHFFIFPSKEPREGHSNSLTEAMAWGLIPIATNHGFTASVVHDETLCFNDLNPHIIADTIIHLFENNLVAEKSKQIYNRVMNYYTENIAFEKIKEEYNYLFNKDNA